MNGKEGLNVNDHPQINMSPSLNGKGNSGQVQTQKKEYGAVLSCTLENCREMFEVAVQSREVTKKPIMIIIEGEK